MTAYVDTDQFTDSGAGAQRQSAPQDLYRPTLVIGLGGTGTLVLKRLKRLMAQKFGDQKQTQLFQFLALDTEPEALIHLRGLDVHEFKNLAEMTLRADDIVKAMLDPETATIYEGLRAWWPMYGPNKPFYPGDITHGAKATRCVGRLAFWHRGIDIYRELERKLATTLQIGGLKDNNIPSTGNTAKVFIVCSLAGGTGSGMFLDITYMVRELLKAKGLTAFVTGLLLVDPSPFSEIVQEEGLRRRMEGNCYAALSELDWLMGGHMSEELQQKRQQDLNGAGIPQALAPQNRGWTFPVSQNGLPPSGALYDLQYLNHMRIRSDERPFHVCYLISGTNENARRLRTVESLTEMIAQEIFLEIATPLGRTGRSQLDNVERLSSFSDYRARPLAYSSFAVASLNLTTKIILKQSVLSLAQHTLERLLNAGKQETLERLLTNGAPKKKLEISDQLADHIARLPLDADRALSLLVERAEKGTDMKFPTWSYSAGISGEQYQKEALRLRQRLEQLVTSAHQPAYQAAAQTLADESVRALSSLVEVLLGRPDVSLNQISGLLGELLSRLDHTLSEAAEQRELASQEVQSLDQSLQNSLNKLDKALKLPDRQYVFVSTNKPELVGAAARPILGELQSLATARIDTLRWQLVASMAQQVHQQLRQYRDILDELRSECERLLREVRDEQERGRTTFDRGSLQYQLEFEALDAQDVAALSQQIWKEISTKLLGRVLLGERHEVTSKRSSVWDHRVIQYFSKLTGELLETNDLLSLLAKLYSDDVVRLERQFKKLVEYAEPFCSLNLTKCPEVAQWSLISLVGYAGATRVDGGNRLGEVLEKMIDRFTKVDTNEPNQVIFLKTKHGLPLFALSLLNGMMRNSYYEFRNGWLRGDLSYRPVHLAQNWANLQDFNPSPNNE